MKIQARCKSLGMKNLNLGLGSWSVELVGMAIELSCRAAWVSALDPIFKKTMASSTLA